MRKPSRSMPPAPSAPWTLPSCIAFALIVGVLVAFVYVYPVILLILFAIVVLTVIVGVHEGRRLATLAGERQGESICTFTRSFDYRRVDTWVIRAVFEELQPYCRFGRRVLPLRAADDLDAVLRIDPEDLDDLASDMAFRAGRSLEDSEKNPFFGKVKTVSDLVSFLANQPSRKGE